MSCFAAAPRRSRFAESRNRSTIPAASGSTFFRRHEHPGATIVTTVGTSPTAVATERQATSHSSRDRHPAVPPAATTKPLHPTKHRSKHILTATQHRNILANLQLIDQKLKLIPIGPSPTTTKFCAWKLNHNARRGTQEYINSLLPVQPADQSNDKWRPR